MKRFNILKSLIIVLFVTVGATSCEDFLTRPTIDNYTVDSLDRKSVV